MIISDVIDDIGQKLATITDLRVIPYEADDINCPGAMISLPTNIDYLGTYRRGMDTLTLIIILLVSNVDDRLKRNEITAYADGHGERSIKEVLENGKYNSFDVIAVKSAAFDVIQIGRTKYLGCKFTTFVSGQGN